MHVAQRTILILTLLLFASAAVAQETATAAPAATTTAAATTTTAATSTTVETDDPAGLTENSYEVRSRFGTLLRQSPPQLATILAIEPTLLANDAFLAQYPELAKFVGAHPEVRQHPSFFLGEFQSSQRPGVVTDILDMLGVGFVLLLLALSGSWLIRTIVEHRRWSRLARTQTEVHTKLLDRFGTSAEVLEYMRTPAGTRFLESAPIPVHAEQSTHNAPVTRVLWSIQFGIVIAAAAVGMLLVSGRVGRENAEGLFALGVVALAIGIGFVASALISLFVSRRLGLWRMPESTDQVS